MNGEVDVVGYMTNRVILEIDETMRQKIGLFDARNEMN